jgi:hypothetical protein
MNVRILQHFHKVKCCSLFINLGIVHGTVVIVDMQLSLENFNHIAIAKYPNSSHNLMLREMVLTCHVK